MADTLRALRLCAFADEAADSLEEQIDALRENGVSLMELRGVDGKSVAALTREEAADVSRRLADAGVGVWAIGSPFGKSPLASPFDEAREQLLRLMETAHIVGAPRLRVFSFYPAGGQQPDDALPRAAERLSRACELAQAEGLRLCHENEKGIVGDTAPRCAWLLENVPGLLGVFDPANFIQCGQDAWAAWETLRARIHYLHVKDARSDGTVVPAGQGEGSLARIVSAFAKLPQATGVMTVEPHLRVLPPDALKEHGKTPGAAPAYASRRLAFAAAVQAVRSLI